MPTRFSIYYQSKESGDYLQQIVRASGSGVVVETSEAQHLLSQGANTTDVVILEYPADNDNLDQWIEKTAANPKSPVIFLYFQEISTNKLWKALRLGIKECFTYPIKEAEFLEAVDRVMARLVTQAAPPGATQVIVFMGCKGGSGTTFTAANVGALLAREKRGQVVLMDVDLHYGQLTYFFDIQPQHTMGEAVANINDADSTYMQSLLHSYDKFLGILAAPSNLEEAEAVTPDHLVKIIKLLRTVQGVRWIIVDAGNVLNEHSLRVLEVSDALELLIPPTIPALSNGKKLLGLFRLLGLEALPTRVWINGLKKSGELQLEEMAKFLGNEISGALSNDAEAVDHSINEGRPLVDAEPRHALCQELRTLASAHFGEEAEVKEESTGWGWFKRLGRRS